jgi:hypothetical protein
MANRTKARLGQLKDLIDMYEGDSEAISLIPIQSGWSWELVELPAQPVVRQGNFLSGFAKLANAFELEDLSKNSAMLLLNAFVAYHITVVDKHVATLTLISVQSFSCSYAFAYDTLLACR